MKKIILGLMSLVFVFVLANIVSAEINAVTPSTNDINRANGWAHVNQVSQGVGTTDLQFVSTQAFWSCFEYRIDNESNTVTGANPNTNITDGRWTQVCVNNSQLTKTIQANEFIDVRMVYGAETDERFDWTRFDVLLEPGMIISPIEGQEVPRGEVFDFEAKDIGAKNGEVQWAVREGTCAAGTNTVAGNVDLFNSDYTWEDGVFIASIDTSGFALGEHCFVFNPTQGDRLTQLFEIMEPVDNIAPSVPQNLKSINPVLSCGAVTNSSSIVAAWDASTDNVGVLGYRYWVTTPNRDANNAWTTTVNGTSRFGMFNEGEGAYTFKVRAFDAASNYSDWSSTCTFVYDATPPVVTIISPTNNSQLSGMVDVRATIEDDNLSHYNVAIYDAGVDVNDFSLRKLQKQTSTSEFEDEIIWSFDSTLLPDGDYQIRLAARDLAGNRDLSNPDTGGDSSVHVIQITVNNTPPEPEEPTDPTTKDYCMKSGWKDFGFKNQGQCVRFVETGKDSR